MWLITLGCVPTPLRATVSGQGFLSIELLSQEPCWRGQAASQGEEVTFIWLAVSLDLFSTAFPLDGIREAIIIPGLHLCPVLTG
jgi:hypothetical protein